MIVTASFLADAATVESGKLYVHGGGWDTIFASEAPLTHPSMALVLIFRVEYDETLRDISTLIELMDEDNRAVELRIEGALNVGHLPGSQRGTPTFVPQTVTCKMLKFPNFGGYQFRVSAEGLELATIPFRVAKHPVGTGLRTPGSPL